MVVMFWRKGRLVVAREICISPHFTPWDMPGTNDDWPNRPYVISTWGKRDSGRVRVWKIPLLPRMSPIYTPSTLQRIAVLFDRYICCFSLNGRRETAQGLSRVRVCVWAGHWTYLESDRHRGCRGNWLQDLLPVIGHLFLLTSSSAK